MKSNFLVSLSDLGEKKEKTDFIGGSVFSRSSSSFGSSDYLLGSTIDNDNINSIKNQDFIYLNSSSDSIDTSYRDKKINSLLLSDSLYRLSLSADNDFKSDYFLNHSFNVRNCSTYISLIDTYDIEKKEFISKNKMIINSCRYRLCPVCSKRRSIKLYSQTSKVIDYILSSDNNISFLFLTLTIPNCSGFELSSSIDLLNSSYKRLFQYKKISNISLGCVRVLEITRNKKTNEFHPHLHIIIAVKNYYFKSKFYLNQREWQSLWCKACRKDNLIVDIRKVRSKDIFSSDNDTISYSKAIKEVSKYSVKSSDYICKYKDGSLNARLTDYVILSLDTALSGRRLFQYSGIFKSAFSSLRLSDIETLDNLSDDITIGKKFLYLIRSFSWGCGAFNFDRAYISDHIKN